MRFLHWMNMTLFLSMTVLLTWQFHDKFGWFESFLRVGVWPFLLMFYERREHQKYQIIKLYREATQLYQEACANYRQEIGKYHQHFEDRLAEEIVRAEKSLGRPN